MEIKAIEGGVCAPKGFTAGGIYAGIKKDATQKDLAMILCEKECSAAAVYTKNKVKGAPLAVTKYNIANGHARAVLCNSGNANTCNPDGMEVAKRCCEIAAENASLLPADIIIASTGVIGQKLELKPFEKGIPVLVKTLDKNGSARAAQAIMTTDTVLKEFAVEFELDGKACRLGAIGKGSGMINPNMATMIVFVTTDANIASGMLEKALKDCVDKTLNQISVDGDTSTNDMAAVLACGLAGNTCIESENDDYNAFCLALEDVLVKMARALAADGEGATKLLTCKVSGARSDMAAQSIAKTVIASDLFKTAMFAADANWGRALCAIGYAKGEFSADDVTLTLASAAGEVVVCKHSAYNPYSEEEAAKVLSEREIEILIDMNDGKYTGKAWGCDLSYEYVRINGDYRT